MKIISGGQTGVDRAALDIAIKHGINYGGWVPKGGLADDYLDNRGLFKKYKLQEVLTTIKEERTIKNVLESDVTIIIVDGLVNSPGTITTARACADMGHQYFLIDLKNKVAVKQLTTLLNRLVKTRENIRINFAGPSEKESPGIYEKTFNILGKSL